MARSQPPVGSVWTLHVKKGAETYVVSLPASATAAELQDDLERETGVFARKQKLIYKGKCLDTSRKLQEQGVVNGAKLMLLQGDGKAQTMGQRTAQAALHQKQVALQQRLTSSASASTSIPAAATAPPPGGWPERRRVWGKTGIIALRDMGLQQMPLDLFDVTLSAASVADISLNQLVALPDSVALLTGLQTLRLGSNSLTDSGIPWRLLCTSLTNLAALHLDSNQLTSLPPPLSGLSSLRRLSATTNHITTVAAELGTLTCLELLLLDDNHIEVLPCALGGCSNLVEISACRNRIRDVPASFSALQKLQTLRLDDNRVRSVPAEVLLGCTVLSALSLASNPVTAEQLRQAEGWGAYDARRRARADKAIDMSVLAAGGKGAFDEGADQQEWQRWAPAPQNKE